MTDQPDDTAGQSEFLAELVREHANVAGDILQIAANTWAIHATIPVDGEVIVAEYASVEDASAALSHLSLDETEP